MKALLVFVLSIKAWCVERVRGRAMGIVDRLRQSFKRIFSVNPQWTSSIAADEFRSVAPGSQPVYKAPSIPRFEPDKYHYYKRDGRRNIPETVVIANPELIPGAPRLEASVQESIAAESEELMKDADLILNQHSNAEVFGMRPPTKKYQYRLADSQPESNGYFTTTNYT